MSIGEKHIIRYYTIVEVMVAMAIFLVMMTIMMQFFNSAQKIWGASSKRNIMYADARVAMNLMTRELQSMMYRNDAVDSTGIYPFWYEWTDINAAPAGNTLLTRVENYNTDHLTALNFIATTDIRSVDKSSNICEIRYKFVPFYISSGEVEGGTLRRSCTEEYYDNSGTDTITPNGAADDYNFAANPYADPAPASRVSIIWKDNTTVDNFRTVISGIYSLRFVCYVWNGGQLVQLTPMNDLGSKFGGGAITTPMAYDLATGTPAPIAVRVDMKLLAPEDLKKLAFAIQKSDTKQIKTLEQKMRTFSKVIYIGKRD